MLRAISEVALYIQKMLIWIFSISVAIRLRFNIGRSEKEEISRYKA
ncbi:MAG TPA: hypothetical protein VGK64_12940 [Bryobacteraceae bacterium]